jgi:hypothetical protein
MSRGYTYLKGLETGPTEFPDAVTGSVVGAKTCLDVSIQEDLSGSLGNTTNTGVPFGLTVSVASVELIAANTDRRAVIITNNSTGKLFIGNTSTVASTGAAMGMLVGPFGTYQDSGDGLYVGALHGIYDVTVTAHNISVTERTSV